MARTLDLNINPSSNPRAQGFTQIKSRTTSHPAFYLLWSNPRLRGPPPQVVHRPNQGPQANRALITLLKTKNTSRSTLPHEPRTTPPCTLVKSNEEYEPLVPVSRVALALIEFRLPARNEQTGLRNCARFESLAWPGGIPCCRQSDDPRAWTRALKSKE